MCGQPHCHAQLGLRSGVKVTPGHLGHVTGAQTVGTVDVTIGWVEVVGGVGRRAAGSGLGGALEVRRNRLAETGRPREESGWDGNGMRVCAKRDEVTMHATFATPRLPVGRWWATDGGCESGPGRDAARVQGRRV